MGGRRQRRGSPQHGVAVVEYALLLALVAAMALSALRFVGESVLTHLGSAGDEVAEQDAGAADPAAPPTTCPGKSEGKGKGKGKNCP